MVGTGCSWLQEFAINAGARNIRGGQCRVPRHRPRRLAYPDFAKDSFPTGCPPFDKEGYGQIIKQARKTK